MTQQKYIYIYIYIWKDSIRHLKQRLNNTTKGKTQQHNIEKDSN